MSELAVYCQHHFRAYLARIDIFFFEVYRYAEGFQLAHRLEAVFGVSREPRYGFCQYPIDFPFAAVAHQSLKLGAFRRRRSGNTLIGVHIDEYRVGAVLEQLCVIANLRREGVELILAVARYSGVGGGSDDFVRMIFSRYDCNFRHLITPFHNTVYRNDSGLSITNATKISAAVCIITNKSGHGFKHPKAAL